MEITEVRIKLMESSEDRLRGFCSITFDDCFVVRDLKIIEGNNGPFVAMPSRKLTSNCPKCRTKNHLRASYCNNCGNKLSSNSVSHDSSGRAKLYADIAHPVNSSCREMIQNRVIDELNREVELSGQPGYKSRYDDDYDDVLLDDGLPELQQPKKPPAGKSQRQDEGARQQPTPHDPKSQNPDVSSGRSKPATDDFGNGIFD